ncbi:hypothetical protein COCSADRAFT_166824 [Bipolaris sorokiniana ND90Pr]|uniref:Uncharacterized protein n=1 Tax=Cochliobolus sativus (strain ND90Pr / ATCC 201652) TaxID=665912 RepID=M2TL50_COCSN|nr:uncharacterized protein COCSADRAFT_166824 [Bipolaris sorokiniana ND90Pr]EMD69876.1 hypothetical protein COCSADRAFT_166824 [Bipolaris sorokiniana ND90Pr]
MRETTGFPGPLLERNTDKSAVRSTKQCPYASIFDQPQGYFEEAMKDTKGWDTLHRYHGSRSQQFGDANEFDQSSMANTSFDKDEPTAPDQNSCAQASQSAAAMDTTLPHGLGNCIKRVGPNFLGHEPRKESSQSYMFHRRSFSGEEPSFATVLSAPPTSSRHSSAPPHIPGQHYGPFLGRFRTSEDAKVYRRDKMRFGRRPWRDPDSDPTIAETEHNRDFHVERIYNAMICGDFARDNAKSTALKRWVHEPHYSSDLVEAYAHKVFDCLLEQVKKGFRGWNQNDYVNDERKGEDDDKDIDCAGRLKNVIAALRQEKSICENVMSSAWQIRMFVNAPKAYAKRKDQNRVGNSKRPNAKSNEGAEGESRPSKRRRNTVQSKQAQQRSLMTESGLSRGSLPRQQYQSHYQPSTERPPKSRLAARESSVHFPSYSHDDTFGHQGAIALTPATSSRQVSLAPRQESQYRIAPMPVVQQSPFSPLPISPGIITEAHTPDGVRLAAMAHSLGRWQGATDPDFPIDTSRQLDNADYTMPYTGCSAPAYDNTLEQPDPSMGICLADTEIISSLPTEEELQDDIFQQYWAQHHSDLQQSPYTPGEQKHH